MEKQVLLDIAEEQMANLNDAITTLRLVIGGLDNNVRTWKENSLNYPAELILNHCDGVFLVLRELDRIYEDLETAIETEYENRKIES